MGILSRDECSQALSLSESELRVFLESFPPHVQRLIAAEIDDAGRPPQFGYADSQSAKVAAIQNAKTAAAQEIGPLPEPEHPQRRERCSRDNLLFAETYFPKTFYLPWAPYQRTMMDRFQEAIMDGGKECHAVRRGGLKSTCARASTIWAAVNGHLKFPVLVGATEKKAKEHRKNMFDMLASSELLLRDYPELLPLMLKWRQPKKSYRLDGRILTVQVKDDMGRIVFPDIYGAPSCQTHVAPFSIDATDVSGLAYVDRFGVTIRPDGIIYDDVQTPQSARSPSQTDEREHRITTTFAGLKGLGQKMAEIMVCTVRNHDCLTMRFVNRERHPDWAGELHKSILKMPDRMDLWEIYKQKLSGGRNPAEGKQQAQEYYAANRAAMDEGAEVAWEYDKQPEEISALQSLMTIWALDVGFFRCEIQQEGEVPVNTSGLKLDSQALLARVSGIDRGEIPDKSSYLTAFIDSQDAVLFWMVVAWAKDCSGWIVDYGTWPDQGRAMFYKRDLSQTILGVRPGASWEEAFVHAHNECERMLFHRFPELDLVLKDWSDGQHKARIESQVMASKDRNRIRPSKGFAPSPNRKPVHLWGDERKDRQNGMFWVERRSESPVHVQYDVNQWKSHAARRLLTTVGAPSCVLLPGSDERAHRLLCEHFTAEQPKQHSVDGVQGVKWELLPARDNDFWDCFVGNCVAASMVGVSLNGEQRAKPERRTFQLPGGVRR